MTNELAEGILINQTVVRLNRADVTDLEVDAFVFYAQPDLALGSGFGGAIAVRGGPSIQQEVEELAPVATGEAVVSAAGKMKAQHIIHAVGPRFQEEDIEGKLRTTMTNALKRAEEIQVETIAFPAMGAGYYGIAPDLCARVMLEVIKGHLEGETRIKELVICVLDTPQHNAFKTELEKSQ
ncbi:MAG: macro domain-containing protein [Gemmatimonadota bacterium]|nr:MAG: macro domain-containing protein [Gemmatimonadota bacterium]